MAVNSKIKGGNFERFIAAILTVATGSEWHRVGVCFGACGTTQGLGTGFIGDVFSEDEKWKDIVVECKNVKQNVSLQDLQNFRSLFWSWIQQT